MKLLCLSNGHGEDEIAIRIVRELQQQATPPEIVALPIVGEGQSYTRLGIPLLGPTQVMPSGGFIYMDQRQLLRDLRGGLVQLARKQLQATRNWAKQGGKILAVGDIVPLLFAWLSGATYAFVGTAKSEYYLRDESGPIPRTHWWQPWEGWSGSVYLPWERWLMSRWRCKAVFPRDRLTTETLQRWAIPAFDLGNPMMDGLKPQFLDLESKAEEAQRPFTVVLLPGSRAPEAYNNWQQIVAAITGLVQEFASIVFLAAIAPGLNLEPLSQILQPHGWRADTQAQRVFNDPAALIFTQGNATLLLTQHAYSDCLHQAAMAIAMAGTATEQFVGLGKPAIAMSGAGPQFTPRFAEAQTRLLGPSLILVQPTQVTAAVKDLLNDPNRLSLIAENGSRRMGQPGAARRIAVCLLAQLG